MLADAPGFDDIAEHLAAARLNGAIVVGHNLRFDTRMVGNEFGRANIDVDWCSSRCGITPMFRPKSFGFGTPTSNDPGFNCPHSPINAPELPANAGALIANSSMVSEQSAIEPLLHGVPGRPRLCIAPKVRKVIVALRSVFMTRPPAWILVFATLTAAVPTATSAPAAATPCPDVEVLFGRGSNEPPGLGSVGGPFVDELRARVAPRTVDTAAVDYPASNDFQNSVPAGIDAARSLIESTAASCPNTKMVLGGYSQGAAIIEGATDAVSPQVAAHVAATALFGTPRTGFAGSLAGRPLPTLAPQLVANSIDQCNQGDPICWEGGVDMGAHLSYVQSGKVAQAADFVASRL